tara:strand:+ start:47 stop:442 length:396 start_codon:yes stop_codon:yes gene_type:complete
MLNKKGYKNAKSHINGDKIDLKSDWSFSAEDGNKLLGENGDDWKNYAKWFLYIDVEANEETKDRYKFPFGKNDKVYKSALNAIRQRAAQFDYTDVFDAAGELLEMIAKKEDAENKIKEEFKGVFDRFIGKI